MKSEINLVVVVAVPNEPRPSNPGTLYPELSDPAFFYPCVRTQTVGSVRGWEPAESAPAGGV